VNYVGIDLHSNNNYVVVANQEGRRLLEKRLPNDVGVIVSCLRRYDPIDSVALESTYNYYWLADGLLDAGHEVKLANPLAMKPYAGLKRQDDRSDAGFMAELLRLGILPTGHLYARQQRGLRDLLRQRSRWVLQKRQILQSVQSRFARCLGLNLSGSQLQHGGFPEIGDEDQDLAVCSQLEMIRHLSEQIRLLEERVENRLLPSPHFRALTAIPGIGRVLASTICLESGDLSRFTRVGDYASYARVVQADRITNNRRKGKGNRRCGNAYLGWAYHEAAHCMNRTHPLMQEYRKRALSRNKHPRVVWSTMAHKVCRGLYFVLRDGVEFSPARLFG
jgi:transposase